MSSPQVSPPDGRSANLCALRTPENCSAEAAERRFKPCERGTTGAGARRRRPLGCARRRLRPEYAPPQPDGVPPCCGRSSSSWSSSRSPSSSSGACAAGEPGRRRRRTPLVSHLAVARPKGRTGVRIAARRLCVRAPRARLRAPHGPSRERAPVLVRRPLVAHSPPTSAAVPVRLSPAAPGGRGRHPGACLETTRALMPSRWSRSPRRT